MGMLKKAASGVLAIFPCSRSASTLRAQKWLRPCWTDFFDHSRRSDNYQRLYFPMAIIGSLALGIFVIDCWTPLGIGIGSLYLLVVFATLPFQNSSYTLIAMVGATFLIILGYWSSPVRIEFEAGIINRSLSILCVWITGIIVLKNTNTHIARQRLKEELQDKFDLQTQELKEQNAAKATIIEDMTVIKNQLQDKEHHLQVLVDAFPSGMLIVDQLGKVVFANKLIETLFGYSQQELIGESVDMLVPQRFQQAHSQQRVAFLQNPSAKKIGGGRDLFGRRKDGSEFPVEIGLNPLSTPEGLIVLSSVMDMTARKKTELDLHHLNQQLVSKNQELESYASAVSHDLRAPLRAIHNYADFLSEDLLSQMTPEQKDYLTGITTAIQEAEKLISDLLELSRLDSQKSAPQVCDIERLVKKVLRALNVDQGVKIQMPPTWPTVFGHEHLLSQVFQNLISNGVKFNRSPNKKIELNWQQEANGFARFSIHDNGIGISPQYQNKIFQVFQRLHTTKEYEGTGIGLTIVKKAVCKMGGEMSMESEVGKGSVFTFTVPMGECQHDERDPQFDCVNGRR